MTDAPACGGTSYSSAAALVSRDGAPSMAALAIARGDAAQAMAVVSTATALGWARRNNVTLPSRGRCAAINQARLACGLPAFVVNVHLVDDPLPRLVVKRGVMVVV